MMEMACLTVEIFTLGSTRADSTSYAINQGVPIKAKLTAAGWSQESTSYTTLLITLYII